MAPPGVISGLAASARDANSTAIDGTGFPSIENVNGNRRITSSESVYTLRARMLLC